MVIITHFQGKKKLFTENKLKITKNKAGTDQFQDCCKNQTFNPGFCYYGCKKVINFKSF